MDQVNEVPVKLIPNGAEESNKECFKRTCSAQNSRKSDTVGKGALDGLNESGPVGYKVVNADFFRVGPTAPEEYFIGDNLITEKLPCLQDVGLGPE